MGKRALLLACVGYSALTLLLTWPLVLHLTSVLPNDAEDPLLNATILWWNARAVPLTTSWWNPPIFWPIQGALALSEHLVGVSLAASPLLWLGVGPVTTYNVVFLLSFPLSALAAHTLGHTLTGRHDAAAIAGLAFGFNPYRIDQLAHLQMLWAFWMPVALLALHRYGRGDGLGWLTLFGVAWFAQAVANGYYLAFFPILIALWLLWFIKPLASSPRFATVIAVWGVASLPLLPFLWTYHSVQQSLGLSRTFDEVVSFSSDVTSVFTASPLVAAWGWTSALNGDEGRTFPGLTIMILVALGILDAFRRRSASSQPIVLARLLLAVASIFGVIAVVTAIRGAWSFNLGPMSISSRVVYKPLSVALAALAGSIGLSARAREAFKVRSPFAFYVLAAMVLTLCAMGPRPAFLGHQILYQAPYAWLMHLPLFDRGVRVPARFAMPAALALSVAASLAFTRLSTRGSRHTTVALAIVVSGILADTWVRKIPLAPVPDSWNPPPIGGFAAVVELPLGGSRDDVAAMYRTLRHHLPTVNGYSGYTPPHYDALRIALANRDETALETLASSGPLLVAADRNRDGDWSGFVRGHHGATRIGGDGRWVFFSLPRTAAVPLPCDTRPLPIAAASDNRGPTSVAPITDDNKFTWWTLGRPQQVGDWLMLDLGQPSAPCAVILRQDGFQAFYPRAISVTTSIDGGEWTPGFSGKTGGLAVLGALESPVHPHLAVPLGDARARFIKVRVEQALERDWWVVTDVSVVGKR